MFVGDAFNAEERTVVAGYDNGDIKMFDLKKMAVRWETNIKNGVLSLILFDILLFSNKIIISNMPCFIQENHMSGSVFRSQVFYTLTLSCPDNYRSETNQCLVFA